MITVHINRPSSTRYVAQVRWWGCRRWVTIGSPGKSHSRAVAAMASKFEAGGWKRGRVLVTAEWCEPVVTCEISR